MKKIKLSLLLTVLMSMVSMGAWADGLMYDDGYYYKVVSTTDKTVELVKPDEGYYSGNFIVPQTTSKNGKTFTVVGIGEYALCAPGLTSISLPPTITFIKESAFMGTDLMSVEIPNSVKEIGRNAFAWCESLKSVTIPYGVTDIGPFAFMGCASLDNVTIPESVTYISESLFESCGSLTYLSIPNSVTGIGSHAFNGLNIESITLPEGLEEINSDVFVYCFNLKSIVIPENVTTIHGRAFFECSGLKSVVLPKNLRTLEQDAFIGCENIEHITCKSSLIGCDFFDISDAAFSGNVQAFADVYVPEGSISRYQNNGWSGYNLLEDSSLPVQYALEVSTNFGCGDAVGYVLVNEVDFCDTMCGLNEGLFPVDKGGSATLGLYPGEGFRISKVEIDGIDITNQLVNNAYTLNNVNANHEVSVEFSMSVQYNLYVYSNYDGYDEAGMMGDLMNLSYYGDVKVNDILIDWHDEDWFTGNKPILVDEGSTPILTFIPYNANTEVSKVTVNGTEVTNQIQSNTYTMPPVTGNCDVYVEFDNGVRIIEANYYTDYGNVYLDDKWIGGYFDDIMMRNNVYRTTKDATVRMTIEPYEGYKIKSVRVGGNDVTTQYLTDGYYDISNIPLVGIGVFVEFEEVAWYTVSLNDYDYGAECFVEVNGMDPISNSLEFAEGDQVTVSVNWSDVVKVTSVSINGTPVASGNNIANPFSYTFNISEDVVIDLQVEENPHILAVSYTGDGSVTIEGNNVASGTNYQIAMYGFAFVTIQADDGCEIESVLYNGNERLTNFHSSNFEFDADYSEGINQTLVAKFRRAQCFIATNIQGNGTVAIGGVSQTSGSNTAYDPDQDLTVTFTPGAGWELASAIIDDNDITSDVQSGTYTIKKISANKTINVTFAPVSLTFSTYRYMTICSPKGLDFRGVSDVKAWTVTGFDGNKIYLTRLEIVPAGKGVLLEAAVGTSWTPTFTDEKFYMANLLVGTLNPIWLDVYSYNAGDYCRNYIFSNGTKGLGFYPLDSAGDFAAGKAYLPIPTYVVDGARGGQFTLDFDGGTDGIDSVNDDSEAESVFSISGVRVDTPKKGLYIKNGKKIVVK